MSESQRSESSRVYLDNAATSWPKCSEAIAAAATFVQDCGATTGRGTYRSAMHADRWLEKARANLAKLIGARRSADIALCTSGTHALNAAIWGLLRPGDHVITTSMEHNSVLRPLKQLESQAGIEISIVESDRWGRCDAEHCEPYFRDSTKLIVVGHASNVTGAVNDLLNWSQYARARGIRLLVDASQTLGYIPIDVSQLHVSALAAAGHKGLRALPGTGLLYLSQDCQADFRPLMFGGTGRASESIEAIPLWPQSVEVGNLNLPGFISMAVAADLLNSDAASMSCWHDSFLRLVSGLMKLSTVHVVGIEHQPSKQELLSERIPVVSIQVDGWDVHDLASVLDNDFQIEVRSGWHCAALIHSGIGTDQSGGTLRISTGHATTAAEIDYTLRSLGAILG